MLEIETPTPVAESQKAPLHFGSIIIVGGGCYGSYYLRQLLRGRAAGAISWEWITVVDRDIGCAVGNSSDIRGDRVSIAEAEWTNFFASYLADCRSELEETSKPLSDAIVPSPLMPHLLYEWLVNEARERWPSRKVETRRFELPTKFPWSRETDDGTRYVSFADWMCPINCIEPKICPHTRGTRDWSIPEALRSAMSTTARSGEALKGPVIFHCTHRAYGVGMIDTADVVAADRFVENECANGGDVLVATASHCHGAVNVLSVST